MTENHYADTMKNLAPEKQQKCWASPLHYPSAEQTDELGYKTASMVVRKQTQIQPKEAKANTPTNDYTDRKLKNLHIQFDIYSHREEHVHFRDILNHQTSQASLTFHTQTVEAT